MNRKKLIESIFSTHKNADDLFITSDDQVFFTEEAADSHASRLIKKDVETVSRYDSDNESEGDLDNIVPLTGHSDNLTRNSEVTGGSEYIPASNNLNKLYTAFTNTEAVKAPDADKVIVKAAVPAIDNAVVTGSESGTGSTPEGENPKDAAIQNEGAEKTSAANSLNLQGENAAPVKSALQVAQETPEADRTPIQKGLITKAAKAADKETGGDK